MLLIPRNKFILICLRLVIHNMPFILLYALFALYRIEDAVIRYLNRKAPGQ